MADCSKNINPLVQGGLKRSDRILPGIDPNFAVPDDHNFEDWMVFSRNFAAHIKYFNTENKNIPGENWQPFFDTDVSAQLALIAVQNVDDYKERVRLLFNAIQSEALKSNTNELKTDFGLLFGALFSLANRLDYFQKILPDTVKLKQSIRNLIKTNLAPALRRLLVYFQSANEYSPSLLSDTADSNWTILAYKQEKASEIIADGLSEIWIFKSADDGPINNWNDYLSQIHPDSNIYKTISSTPFGAPNMAELWATLNHVISHNLFSGIFATFLSAYARVVRDAQQQLMDTIISQNTHEPHYALYLTFLHLFKQAQTQLNTYTQRHLDFYYKEVLQLKPKASEPNHVYLGFELANLVNSHLISAGTAFKAGKDRLGKDVVYTSDRDIIVNKATVAELRSFYRAIGTDKMNGISQAGNLYASPIANSADGAGAKITSEEQDWHPFANKVFKDGDLSAIAMPPAIVGFAFSSHYFFLKEGKRSISITLHGSLLNMLNGKQFDCYLTTPKAWLHKDISISGVTANHATITVQLSASDQPITTYNAKIHADIFGITDTPVVKLILKNTNAHDQYNDLKDVKVSSVDIKVNVGTLAGQANSDGIKELLIATDTGTADPSKPFIPFGQNPKKGAGLVIGNKELFSKANAKFKLFIDWAELVSDIRNMDVNLTGEFFPTAQLKFLQNGVWKDGNFSSILNKEHGARKTGELELFWGANYLMMAKTYLPSSDAGLPDETIFNFRDEYLPYNIASQTGFLKLELNADFQWDDYYMKLQKYLIGLATPALADDTTEPAKPYLPKIQSLYLSYEASTTLNFKASESGAFYHIFPFGIDAIDESNISGDNTSLMPQFAYFDESKNPVHNQAEFYIGLKNALPPQKVNLLFKVLDGSTDPQQSKPENHVRWSFLSNNIWIDFDKDSIKDTTRQLINTGIISFALPEKANTTNTVLPSGMHWLKASITQFPEQVCRMIEVRAQVVEATFFDQQNAPDFLLKPLAANTISKLNIADPAIKKVEQPFSSFGGRYIEDSRSFYTRVSERLRHKNRAITIRDFEQLVLEKYTDIHKVKCLNHTRLEMDVSPVIYNELAPGHVTVITIPNLLNHNAINPLRPFTSRNRLNEIKEYLQGIANCNMKLHVENPVFEEVRVITQIILTAKAAGNDSFYIDQLKHDLVKYFTPWAYNLNTDISFGGKITKSSIINYIEDLDYVDVILDLHLFHNKEDQTSEVEVIDEIIAATARSILVSAPVSKHEVTIIKKPVKSDTSDCK